MEAPKKRPASASEQVLACLDANEFKQDYYEVCRTPYSLPYKEKGGRQPELAIQAAAWARVNKTKKHKFLKKRVVEGFLAIHASRKGEPQWHLADDKAESWAEKMTQRLQLLLRHVKQAEISDPQPPWLKQVFPCEVKQELAEEGDELTAGENPEEEAGEGDEEEALDEEEEEAEDDDQPLVQAQDLEPAYFVGFSEELGKAYRWDPKRRPQKKGIRGDIFMEGRCLSSRPSHRRVGRRLGAFHRSTVVRRDMA